MLCGRAAKKTITCASVAIVCLGLCHIIFLAVPLVGPPGSLVEPQSQYQGKLLPHGHLSLLPLREEISTVDLIRKMVEGSSTFENIHSKKGMDYASRVRTKCRDRTCSEFLTTADERHYKYCVRKTWNTSVKKYSEPSQSSCVFINGSQQYPMGIASYPGSGNTWVRGLLQKVTGLCTGAIYCDVTLRQNGFPGESIRSGVTFLVKSHQIDPRWEGVEYDPQAPFTYFKHLKDVPTYSGGVFIIRNPFHAMVAEFKRLHWREVPSNHVATLGREHFGKY